MKRMVPIYGVHKGNVTKGIRIGLEIDEKNLNTIIHWFRALERGPPDLAFQRWVKIFYFLAHANAMQPNLERPFHRSEPLSRKFWIWRQAFISTDIPERCQSIYPDWYRSDITRRSMAMAMVMAIAIAIVNSESTLTRQGQTELVSNKLTMGM